MTEVALLTDRWKRGRFLFFRWRYACAIPVKVVLCISMACVTGLAAQLRIQLPFTEVPITGQVFAVLLSGVLLGRRLGGMSQIIYLTAGVAGMPWFAGGGSGLLLGPSGGYIVGFIPAAFLVGHFTDRRIAVRGLLGQTFLMMLAVFVIYAFGAPWYAFVTGSGLVGTLARAVLPFFPVDLAKALAAAAISACVLPRASYDGETDRNRFPAKY